MNQRRPERATVRQGGQQTVRIIGGDWRGRKLTFPDIPGLRPTPDRFRETLFNWLMFKLSGLHVLDAFAGSGALGLEAMSRGATSVVLLEQDHRAAQAIRQFIDAVKAPEATVMTTDTLRYLATATSRPFDLVFIDPPFGQGLVEATSQSLETYAHLAPEAWLYVEHEPDLAAGVIPAHWRVHREIRNAATWIRLCRREPLS